MADATDLGFLLHKHPDRVQSFDVMAGKAHVFYPCATETECTVALMLDIDPVELVRHARRPETSGFMLGQYVNDRPYTASSLLSVALGKVFRTALNGRCDARPELVSQAIPLRVHLPVVPSGGERDLVRRLFEPLGWEVDARPLPLDYPEWGDSGHVRLDLSGTFRVSDALNQLYVLLPVLDGTKHYWVAEEEVDKLLRAGGEWLAAHPERELISKRSLAHSRKLVDSALAQLVEPDTPAEAADPPEAETARPLAAQRREEVMRILRELDVRRVLDLGCGNGLLVRSLLEDPRYTEIVGVEVSAAALRAADRKIGLERLPDRQRARLTLRQSALTYTDSNLAGYDAAVLMEVIEHLDPSRLPAMERTVFGHARPKSLVVTTPNAEYNVRYPNLPAGEFRHPDHRFEWGRAEFGAWCGRVGTDFGYHVERTGAGEFDPVVGHPTQIAVFTRDEPTTEDGPR